MVAASSPICLRQQQKCFPSVFLKNVCLTFPPKPRVLLFMEVSADLYENRDLVKDSLTYKNV